MDRGQMNRPISGPRRGCPEMGSRAAAPTASRPFPFKKTAGFLGGLGSLESTGWCYIQLKEEV